MKFDLLLRRPLLVHLICAGGLLTSALAGPPLEPHRSVKKKTPPPAEGSVEKPAAPPAAPVKAAPAGKLKTGKPQGMPLADDAKNLPAADVAASIPPFPRTNGSAGPRPDTSAPPLKAAGPLDVEDLIQHALANYPELQRWRADIAKSEAERRAVWDIEPAEFRVGYTWDTDNSFRKPSTEFSRERLDTRESFDTVQSTRGLGTLETAPDFGTFQRETSSGIVRESRYREIETRTIPGPDRDVRRQSIYEVRRTSENSRRLQSDAGPFGTTTRDARTERTVRKLLGRSEEIIDHPNVEEGQEELSLLLRFRLPNFIERKARVERVMAEIRLAESRYLAEAQKLALDVRERYEELCTVEGTAAATREQVKSFRQLSKDIDQLGGEQAGYGADKFEAEADALTAEADVMQAENKASTKRDELAELCGLADPRRIQTRGVRTRRIMQLQKIDPDWLVAMAAMHRSDLIEAQARMDIAAAELKEVYAVRYPMVTFLDVGWARSESDQRIGRNEEWVVRGGISLPLFDWFGWNKQSEVHKAQAASYEVQVAMARRRIEADVKRALAHVSRAEADFDRFGKMVTDLQKLADPARQAAEMDLQLDKTPDESAPVRTKAKILEKARKVEMQRYELANEYNKAVIALERALGTRIENVLVPVPAGGK